MPRHAIWHRRAVNALTVALDACRSVGVRSKSTFFQIDVLIPQTLAHRRVSRSEPI
jgi:hypothetical protein